MNQKLSLFTFIFLLSTLTLQAQLPSCLQFEGLDPNTSYGSNTTYEPGEVFHTEQQVNMSLETFYYPDGSSAFWNLQTTTNIFNEFPGASDQYLFISNINLTFDLTPLENTFDQLCFSFFDGGGVENLAINGSDPIVVDNLQQLPNDINGVTISVQTNSENPNIGELCLSGNIQTLTIGGQEFGLDALCFFLSNECDISNIEITPQPCNPNNIFYAEVQFDYANVNSDGFTIFGNGQNYGQYAYHELPIEIGPFLADGSTYELIIEDLGDESCQAMTEFTAEDCVTECPISNLQITTPGCNQDSVDLFVDFESTMLNGNFLLYLNEEVYGEYAINELPLYLPNIDFDTNEVIAKVCLGSSDCCLDVPLFLDDCQNNCIGFEELTPGDSFGGNDGNVAGDTLLQTDAYHILLQPYLYENGNTDFVTLFVEDGTFLNPDPTEGNTVFPSNINMEVNFADQLNVDQVCFDFYDFGGSVNLGVNGSLAFAEDFSSFHGQELANGVWVDVFQNEELDFPSGTVCLTGTIEQLTLGGQELTIDDICYEATPPECHINNLLAEALACDNDSFLVLLTFELDDPSALSDDFLVYQNDNLLGAFPLNSTTSAYTLELGPFAGNGDTQYEFSVVAGNDINDCTASYQLGGIDCQDESCRIEDLNAYIEGCEAGNYLLNVDFDVINPQNPFFAVFVNGEFMGEFTFDQFPVVLDGIEPFAPAGANGLIVEVGNSNNPECAAETFVDFIACEEDNCVLFENLLIEGAGSAYANEPGDFIYHENGVNLFVESFTTNSNTGTFGNLLVKNKAQEPSFTAASGQFIQLEEIVAKFTFDQTASVINFDFQATSGLLSIAVNGQPPLFFPNGILSGTYDLPNGITVEINIQDASSLFGSIHITGAIDQLEIGGANFSMDNLCYEAALCEITDINVEFECNPNNGTYDLILDFNHENTSEKFVLSLLNAEITEEYAYADLPIVITNVPNIGNFDDLLITDLSDTPGAANCSASYAFDIPCPINCALTAYDILEVECVPGTATYTLTFDLEHANTSGTFKLQSLVSDFQETYSYADLPLSVSLPVTSVNFDEILICDTENPNCCISFDYDISCGCSINDAVAEAYCNEEEGVNLDIDFNYPASIEGTFTVLTLNGAFIGTFPLADLPITIENIDPLVGLVNAVQIVIDDQPACSTVVQYSYPNCNDECSITDLTVEAYCDEEGAIKVDIDFNYSNTGNDFFEVFNLNGENLGFFALADLPVTLVDFPFNANGSSALQICVNDIPECCTSVDFELPNCNDNCNIDITNFEIYDCLNGAFFIDIAFDAENGGTNGFSVVGNGNNYGTFDYNQPFITIGPLAANGSTLYEFVLKDNENPDCQAVLELEEPINCDPDCGISDFQILDIFCTGDVYVMQFTFNYGNTGEPFTLFSEFSNQQFAFEYHPNEIYTIEFPALNSGQDLLLICPDLIDCCYEIVIDLPCNNDCTISDLVVEAYCDDEGAIKVDIDFNYSNTGNDFFEVFNLDGENLGFFALADLPVTLVDFPSNANGSSALQICVNDIPECCTSVDFELPNCNDNCNIDITNFEIYDCLNGAFFIDIAFDAENGGADGFSVVGNGNNYGTFDYNQPFITIGPLAANGSTLYEFVLKDNENPDCQAVLELEEPINCDPDCGISDFQILDISCSGDVYVMQFTFNYGNTGEPFTLFSEFTNQQFAFEYHPNEIYTIEFPALNTGQDLLLICPDLIDCCYEIVIDLPCNNDCSISDLVVEAYCNEEGGVNLEVDFNYSNPGNDFVEVYGQNGELIDFFPLDALPIVIENYQSSSVSGQLVVCINDVPNCCADASFEIPNCSDDCNFTQVIAEAHSCDGDEFLIDVAVQVNNPGPAGYFVFVNNQIAGPFSYNEPFVTVGPFVGDGTTDYEILIIDIANPACFGSAYLEPVNCDEEACEIGSILAEASDCDEDGLFTIELNFDYNNVGDNGFTVVGNGNNYGTFSYDDLPLTFGPFEGDPEMIYEFGVFDNSNPNCGGFTEIGPIECPDPCLLSDPTVSVQCYDMEDIYELTIDFAYENTFDLFKIDGIGTFSYQELPLSLNLSYDSEQTLYIFDLDNPDCTLEITYDVPCCVLPGLNVELSECQEDGTLTAEIFVENINTQDSFYLTYGNLNGNLQTATYAYADLPVTTDAFVSNPNDQLLFQITDESFFCSAEKLLDAPYCNNEDCVEFEMINGTAFGPSNGYDSGDLISIEDEVKINYFSNEPDCTNCFTFFLNATTYPQFEYGSGKIVALSSGGMELDFSSFSETVEHLSIDFHNLGMWASLQVNADELFNFNAFSELPEEIAPGVTLEITYNNNTNSSGTLHFTGAIESVRLEGMLLLLDNACFQTSPTPDFCMDFMSMDPLNDEIILAQAGDEGIAIYEEDGVVVTAEKVEVGSAQYLEIIQLTNQELCQPAFTQANDSWLQLQGAVRLDFSSFEQKPSFLSFDYAYCEDLDSINLAINDLIRYAGIPGGIPEDFYNDFNITVSPLSNTFHEGSIRIEGNIEKLLIGGMHLRIDNICFDGIPEDEEVWPGDANSDNIAHHIDLLSLGIAYGEAGPNRLSDATAWNALEAENWDGFFEDGTNYKHADCNGDGFIDEFDLNVIDQNYGLTHGPVGGFTELPGTDIDPDIMVDFPDGSQLTTGTIFEVPVIFGTEQQPVEDVYGVAFTVYFNPDVFDPNSLVVEYPVSWFGEPGVNTMHIHKIYEEGYIEIALTRIDHNDVSGFGPIVTIRGIIDDIVGITDDVEVRVEGVLASDANEVRIPIQSINELVPLRINPFVKGNNDLEPLVFPNPTVDVVTITNKADVPVQQIDVFDYSSHLVKTVHDRNEISLADLPQGVYNLKIKIEGRIYHERIVKM